MKKKFFKVVIGILAVVIQIINMIPFIFFSSMFCLWGHNYSEPTCTSPATCSRCDKEKGDTLPHEYSEATCAKPKTCISCGVTEGVSLPHNYIDATCTTPMTCSDCKTVRGNPLEHTYGDWKIETEATVSVLGKRVRYCSVCAESESESYRLDSFVKDNKFIFTPEEFREIFFDNFEDLGYSGFGGAQIRTNDDQVMVAIRDNVYNNVGNIGFVADSSSWRMALSKTENNFDGIIMIISADEEFIANAIISVIMTCNPSINEYEARQVGIDLLTGKATYEDVAYTFAVTGAYYTMTAVPVA